MKRSEYDAMVAQLSRFTSSSRGLIRAVYTGKVPDDELGKVLDALKDAGAMLTAHAEASLWYERFEKEFLDNRSDFGG